MKQKNHPEQRKHLPKNPETGIISVHPPPQTFLRHPVHTCFCLTSKQGARAILYTLAPRAHIYIKYYKSNA